MRTFGSYIYKSIVWEIVPGERYDLKAAVH